MRKSEELKLQAQQEENDLASFGLLCRSLREARSEKFENGWLTPLEMKYPIEKRNNGSYSITTHTYGIIDYFPKANKLLIREKNHWEKPGLKWIINNLLS